MNILKDEELVDIVGGATVYTPGNAVPLPNDALNALDGLVNNPNLNTTAGNSNQQPILFNPYA
ncbi:hypothetical protein [Legionella micdadei]|uniref:Bacteriocin n=1 Tax=Legionella micdadei TaxID=451 RepID=A0A098GGA5_LEGMI|nr:hypothetical protein [Legionella micdadei]ARG97059.1 hypothetical protein B6N58_04905 [Legionella micdadei]ARH00684.1 hypothetical protein B6V88_09790 [Legionella micdadei]KTD26782.1 hypothetical protein Lmic_2876 [Legionella micdadei]NSL18283.1 hypothetical protein [Legionella micdadei]CEG61519.1 protein of unknown function [Legionella micdadei]